jgi:acyl carrier protein
MTRAQLDTMLRAKVAGTWLLHELSRPHELDLFVTFSSTTSLLGAKGLGHYAAANQFLDSFAEYRGACGLPVLNVNWGTWDVMRLATQSDQEFFSQAGLRAMPSDEALTILGDLCAARVARAIVADVDWPALRRVYEARRRRPLLTDLGAAARDVHKAKPAAVANALVQLLRTSEAERARELLTEHVRACVAQVLRVDLAAVASVTEGFFQMGMDSLMTVELRNRLEATLGLKLPPTLAFEFSTVDSLTALLLGELRGPDGGPAESAAAPARAEAPKAAEELRSELDALADDELAALLDQQVGRLLGGEANR